MFSSKLRRIIISIDMSKSLEAEKLIGSPQQ